MRGRFCLLPDEAPPVVLGEVVCAVAFLTQAHEYVRTAYFKIPHRALGLYIWTISVAFFQWAA